MNFPNNNHPNGQQNQNNQNYYQQDSNDYQQQYNQYQGQNYQQQDYNGNYQEQSNQEYNGQNNEYNSQDYFGQSQQYNQQNNQQNGFHQLPQQGQPQQNPYQQQNQQYQNQMHQQGNAQNYQQPYNMQQQQMNQYNQNNHYNQGYGAKANNGARLGAYFLDGLILGIGIVVLMFITTALTGLILSGLSVSTALSIAGIIGFITYVFYFGVSFWYLVSVPGKMDGQTYGKKILSIGVKRKDGQPLDFKTVVMREFVGKWLLGSISFGITYIVSLVMLFANDGDTLHDKIAGTYVDKR